MNLVGLTEVSERAIYTAKMMGMKYYMADHVEQASNKPFSTVLVSDIFSASASAASVLSPKKLVLSLCQIVGVRFSFSPLPQCFLTAVGVGD